MKIYLDSIMVILLLLIIAILAHAIDKEYNFAYEKGYSDCSGKPFRAEK